MTTLTVSRLVDDDATSSSAYSCIQSNIFLLLISHNTTIKPKFASFISPSHNTPPLFAVDHDFVLVLGLLVAPVLVDTVAVTLLPNMSDSTRLFIGNLAWSTTDDSLKQAFEAHGAVSDAKVITDRYTGRSRGFGFVTFSSPEEANSALNNMNGVEVDGRPVRVDRASSRN